MEEYVDLDKMSIMTKTQIYLLKKLGILKNIRFEVIDDNAGRLIVRYGVDAEFSVQDDNKTLKIFI